MVKKPNFLVIGAQKSGTTWLWEGLRKHKEVYLPRPKELEFFSYARKLKDPGFESYLKQHFSAVTDQTAIGEATPSYLWNSDAFPEWCKKPAGFQPNIPQIVNDYLGPETKFLVVLRNPADRAISAYLHHIAMKRFDGSENIFRIGRQGGIIHLGFYHAHITKWYEVFDRSNFMILIFEEILQNVKLVYHKVCEFLDIDSTFIPSSLNKRVYEGIPRYREGRNYYLLRKSSHQLSYEKVDPDNHQLVVSEEDYKRLIKLYAEDVAKLENMLDIDLNIWRTNGE